MQPEILFQDENYLIVNKPSGMIVNNADTSKDLFTLQDFINKNFPARLASESVAGRQLSTFNSELGSASEFLNRGGIVHRLDKETSGVLIVALNEESFAFLQQQFKDRTTKKEYTALCHGKLVEEGEINVPIGRLPWNRMRFGVIPQGRESYTKFKTIEHKVLLDGKNKEDLSLVRVFPLTGRTHQIRVHFQYVGHPIFADSLYAGRKTYDHDKHYLNRHFLHASNITFISPTTKETVTYEAPLSPELVAFLAHLS